MIFNMSLHKITKFHFDTDVYKTFERLAECNKFEKCRVYTPATAYITDSMLSDLMDYGFSGMIVRGKSVEIEFLNWALNSALDEMIREYKTDKYHLISFKEHLNDKWYENKFNYKESAFRSKIELRELVERITMCLIDYSDKMSAQTMAALLHKTEEKISGEYDIHIKISSTSNIYERREILGSSRVARLHRFLVK